MKVIIDNLVAHSFKYDAIAHGCNCYCTMGAGIAKDIRINFPAAYEADMQTIRGDLNKLGNYSYAKHIWNDNTELYIFNAYTQFHYDATTKPLNYAALELCMKKIALACELNKLKLGIPLIGYGLAGGDLYRILDIFNKELSKVDTTIVVWDGEKDPETLKNNIENYLSTK